MKVLQELLEDHRRLRPIRIALNAKMWRALPRQALLQGARKLGILVDGRIRFETEDGCAVLADYCIHEWRHLGRTVVDRFSRRSDLTADERRILADMKGCWLSIFKVLRAVPGYGVEARDLLQQRSLFVIDVNLSKTCAPGKILTARLMPFGEHFISTGAPLPVRVATLAAIVDDLESRDLAAQDPHGSPQARAELAAIVVRNCLAHGETAHIRSA